MSTDLGAGGSNTHPNIFFLEIYEQEFLHTSFTENANKQVSCLIDNINSCENVTLVLGLPSKSKTMQITNATKVKATSKDTGNRKSGRREITWQMFRWN